MSKLFKLKEWVTIPDAALHLSAVCGEAVKEADILYFALNGKLTISVYFVNHTKAKLGKIVGIDDAEWRELPAEMTAGMENLSADARGKPLQYLVSLPIDEKSDSYVNLDDGVVSIDGVWDLPMIGSERLDIEHQFHGLTGGPEVTLVNLAGAFVTRGVDEICQLQEHLNANEYVDGSNAQAERLRQIVAMGKLSAEEIEKLEKCQQQQRAIFEKKQRNNLIGINFYPANGLPEDSILVVRTENLTRFLQSIEEPQAPPEKPLGTKERNTLLKIIGTLVVDSGFKGGEYKQAENLARRCGDLGADVSTNTVNKYLKEAATFVRPF